MEKNQNRKKKSGMKGALLIFATALIPVLGFGGQRTGDGFVLLDEVNFGGGLMPEGGGSLSLNGSVGPIDASPLSDGQVNLLPGGQGVFYSPGPITDLLVSTSSSSALRLTWTAPKSGLLQDENVSRYVIYYSSWVNVTEENFLSVSSFMVTKNQDTDSEEYTLPDLHYDTAYSVGVVAYDSSGAASPLVVFHSTVATLPPNPVGLGFYKDIHDTKLIVEFSPNNPSPDARDLSFEIQIRNAEGESSIVKTTTTVSFSDNSTQRIEFHRDGDIRSGMSYQAFIRTIGSANERTDWVQVSSNSSVLNDRLPEMGVVTNLTSTGFTVNWSNTHGGRSYKVLVDDENTFSSPLVFPSEGYLTDGTHSQDIPNLKGNTTHYHKIQSYIGNFGNNYEGESSTGSTVTLVQPPISVSVEAITSNSATVRFFDNPDNQSGNHKFNVDLATSTSFDLPISVSDITTSNEMTVPFNDLLSPNTTYYVRIRGVNRVGAVSSLPADIYISPQPFFTKPQGVTPTFQPPSDSASEVKISWNSEQNNLNNTTFEASLYASSDCTGNPVQTKKFAPLQQATITWTFSNSSDQPIFANKKYSACVRVFAVSGITADDVFSTPISTFTKPLAPQGVSPTPSIGSISVTWSGSSGSVSNAVGTNYELSWHIPGADSGSGSTSPSVNSFATASPLAPNTTYQLSVRTLPLSGSPWGHQEATAVQSVTLAKEPTVGEFNVYTSSGHLSWGGNGNPTGTHYVVKVATEAGFSSPVTFDEDDVVGTSVVVSTLIPNTTYYARVWGKNSADVVTTNFANLGQKVTDPAQPETPTLSLVNDPTKDIQVTWGQNGNSAGTRYVVLAGTSAERALATPCGEREGTGGGSFASTVCSVSTANTLYYVWVKVVGRNSRELFSSSVPIQTAAAAVSGVLVPSDGHETSRLDFTWGQGQNGPETQYDVELSTDFQFGVGTIVESSSNISELHYTFSSGAIRANTRYFARVKASGATVSWGEGAASTYTHPTIPEDPRPVAVALSSATHQVAFEWGHGTNNAGTQYELKLTTGTGFVVKVTTVSGGVSHTFTESDGVVWANEKYRLEIKAIAADGNPNHHSNAASTSTYTAPLAPPSLSPTPSTGSISVTWSGSSGSVSNAVGTNYELSWHIPGADSGSGSTSPSVNSFATASPLAPNTTYQLSVRTLPLSGSPWGHQEATAVQSVTLAKEPTVGEFNVYTSSGHLSWGGNGNPTGTHYVVKVATGAGFSSPVTFDEDDVVGTSVVVSTLIPNTTYYARVWGKNSADVVTTNFANLGQKVTDPAQPETPTLSLVNDPTKDIQVTWGQNGNSAGTRYVVLAGTSAERALATPCGEREGTGGGSFASTVCSVSTANTLYYVWVKVVGRNSRELFSSSVPIQTAAAAVSGVLVPSDGHETSRLDFTWGQGQNGPETQYDVELSTDFQFGVGTIVESSSNISELHYTFSSGAIRANTRYFARVKASGATVSWGEGAASTYTHPTIPEDPRPVAVALSSATHQVAFEWGHGTNNAGTQYELKLTTGTGFVVKVTTVSGGVSHTFTESDGVVWANEKYRLEIKAIAADGNPNHHSNAASTSTYTAPLAPSAPEVSSITNSSATVGWSPPSLALGSWLVTNKGDTGYRINWQSRQSSGDQGSVDPEAHSLSISSLIPNSQYDLSVVALPIGGNPFPAAASSVASFITPANTPELIASYIDVHQTSVTCHWGNNGNSVGTQYRLEVSSTDFITTNSSTTTSSIATVTDLSPATLYKIRLSVLALNGGLLSSSSTSKNTRVSSPTINSVTKGDQSLSFVWGRGDNGERAVFEAQLGEGSWRGLNYSTTTVVEFSLLPYATPYVFHIRAKNTSDSSDLLEVSTTVWTWADTPGIPTIKRPLSQGSMKIGFPEDNNPQTTEYAIELYHEQEDFRRWAVWRTTGSAVFSSSDPTWASLDRWGGGEGTLFDNLPSATDYQIRLYARNGEGEVREPSDGLPLQQSAGVPLVTLLTPDGVETHLRSWQKNVYWNSTLVPFLAQNSSHYNVIWSPSIIPIESGNVIDSFGWNGNIDSQSAELQLGSAPYPVYDGPVKGFKAEEGVYYLNMAGTAIVDSQVSDTIISTSPFRVYIDTTPPVPTDVAAFFTPNQADEERLSENVWYGDSTPYFRWKVLNNLGKEESRSPVLGWNVLVSADPDLLPATSTSTAQFVPFTATPELAYSIRKEDFPGRTTFYLKIRAYDQAGNWTPDDQLGKFEYRYSPDEVPPRWNRASVVMNGRKLPSLDEKVVRFVAVRSTESLITVGFSEPMMIYPNTNIRLRLLRDNEGRAVETANGNLILKNDVSSVEASVLEDGVEKTLQLITFSAESDLRPGCAYRLFTSTTQPPTDRASNPLSTPIDILFYTAMDPAVPAVFASEDDKVQVRVGAYAFGNVAASVAINDRPEKISVVESPALPRLVDNANNALGRRRGAAFGKLIAAKEMVAFDSEAPLLAQNFGGNVQIFFDYKKELGSDGRVAGTGILPKDLAVYELDEKTGVWSKMPDSRVDESVGAVVTPLRQNGTYALVGAPNYDLSTAHPYPVPFRASQDREGITFTGLSSFGTIKIFTLDGRLVKTLSFDGPSFVHWNPVATDSGEPVGSDVYLYVIENDRQRVVGKLMVIR